MGISDPDAAAGLLLLPFTAYAQLHRCIKALLSGTGFAQTNYNNLHLNSSLTAVSAIGTN